MAGIITFAWLDGSIFWGGQPFEQVEQVVHCRLLQGRLSKYPHLGVPTERAQVQVRSLPSTEFPQLR
jgi:hypothetical protein